MNRRILAVGSIAAVAALALAGCSGSTEADKPAASSGPVTLTMSAWSVDTTPEFKALADAFHEKNPDITINLKEYDATDYNTLITADLAAGSGPDIITQKEVKYVTTLQEGGQLLDVSDVKLPKGIGGADSYKVDGKAYATPYRQDSWVLFYNKDLFKKAGVAEPDGSWTWDDFDKAAAELTAGAGGAKGAYLHRWQSVVQGFANSQTGSNVLKGKYDYMTPFYERVLKLQKDGDVVDFNTSSANQLTYQGEFGKQKAAMMPMGTWFVATLIAQQASGDADAFSWGIAPIPQLSAKTAGLDNTPVTFGDPTGFGVNAAASPEKAAAAKKFLAFASSEDAAQVLAGIGITPALNSSTVADTYFGVKGAPTDDLSKFAWSTHKVLAENPTSSKTAAIQGILSDMHTAIMSGSTPVDAAIKEAQDRVSNEVGLD
ncbi:MAG TPA: extracellular solute-binding protein [Microbacterium sp.]|uniref:ABC transporter substrate-binding protein n=1 Tax=Microbacterium arabinogalactanolyticum TaxID=69365 RepID=UPI002554F8F3|nr:extracellular solute-binding protein [Microbacterium arabinogalactanolyticum]GLC86387.1 sugar ABC transporter substrate-binding protein [Microbacterium arabinogalactanolyticum]HWU30850.1 extracellular solute-binding protein [Microbacterium sp.]